MFELDIDNGTNDRPIEIRMKTEGGGSGVKKMLVSMFRGVDKPRSRGGGGADETAPLRWSSVVLRSSRRT